MLGRKNEYLKGEGWLWLCWLAVLAWVIYLTSGCARVGVQDSTHEVKVSGGTENVVRLEIGSCDRFAENMDEYLFCVQEVDKARNAIDNLDKLFKKAQQEGEGQ